MSRYDVDVLSFTAWHAVLGLAIGCSPGVAFAQAAGAAKPAASSANTPSTKPKECTVGKVVIKSPTFKDDALTVAFELSGVSGCGAIPQSTGKLTYGVRYRDAKNKPQTVSGFEVFWVDQAGPKFDIAPPQPRTFVKGKIAQFDSVVEPKVVHCGCVN